MENTSNFEFSLFPGLAICCMILSYDAGQWQQATASNQAHSHLGK